MITVQKMGLAEEHAHIQTNSVYFYRANSQQICLEALFKQVELITQISLKSF